MYEDPELFELREIYSEMDTASKKKMVSAAAQLLNVQKTLTNRQLTAKGYTRAFIQKVSKKRASIFAYLMIGLLFFFAIYLFWVNLINPALLILGSTPLLMLQIITTALGGIFFIGAGLVRFILYKLTAPWLLLSIGSGVLFVDPRTLTDLVGIMLTVLIVALKLIQWKSEKVSAV